mmetsp:Transcript_109832/g.289731  ORF Transcript_109832/g.289731 Transcript_109832/m.289731 type:complete len:255 (-) Transcript_109832:78-842(-)
MRLPAYKAGPLPELRPTAETSRGAGRVAARWEEGGGGGRSGGGAAPSSSAVAARLDLRALAKRRARGPPGARRGLGGDAVLDLARHHLEGLLHVVRVLGAGLHELHAQGVRQLLGLVVRDDLLRGQIALVSNQQLVHSVRRVLVDLLHPMLHVLERLLIGDVVDDDDAMGAAVITAGDGAESLLAGGVPDLQLHRLAVEVQGADLEIHADGADVALGVRVIRKPQQQARLPHAGVADEQQLEQVVVLRRHRASR